MWLVDAVHDCLVAKVERHRTHLYQQLACLGRWCIGFALLQVVRPKSFKSHALFMELLQQMQLFAKLAELGSFTKVADAMQAGRPHVTRSIQELEAALGVRLFP